MISASSKLIRHATTSSLSTTLVQRGAVRSCCSAATIRLFASPLTTTARPVAVIASSPLASRCFSTAPLLSVTSPNNTVETDGDATTSPTSATETSSSSSDNDTAATTTVNDANDTDKVTTHKKFTDLSSDNTIRKGTIKWLCFKKMCGFIRQDKEYENVGPINTEDVFFHFFDIVPAYERHHLEGLYIKPILKRWTRVQFTAKQREVNGKSVLKVSGLKYEEGGDIPMLKYEDAMFLLRREKANLGGEVFDALETMEDPDEMARRVKESYEKCQTRVEWLKRQIVNPGSVRRTIKAHLGDEVYALLEHAVNVNSLQAKVEEAFSVCKRKVNELDSLFPVGKKSGSADPEPKEQ